MPKKRKPKIDQLEENAPPKTTNTVESLRNNNMVPAPPTKPKPQTSELSSKGRHILESSAESSHISATSTSSSEGSNIIRYATQQQSQQQEQDRIDVGPSSNNNTNNNSDSRNVEVCEDSLGNGSFDENESHASFLEALKAWRGEDTKDNDVEMMDVDNNTTNDDNKKETLISAAIEVQTEPPKNTNSPPHNSMKKTRPVSARSSYFFKKVALTQAAHKAEAAVTTMGR